MYLVVDGTVSMWLEYYSVYSMMQSWRFQASRKSVNVSIQLIILISSTALLDSGLCKAAKRPVEMEVTTSLKQKTNRSSPPPTLQAELHLWGSTF